MEEYQLHCPHKGRLAAAAWAVLPGVLLGGWAFARDMGRTGLFFLAAGAAGGLWLWLWSGRPVTLSPGALQLRGGRVLLLRRIIPHGALTGAAAFAAPGLRLAGCRLTLVFTLRGLAVLPPLAVCDAQRVLTWAARP